MSGGRKFYQRQLIDRHTATEGGACRSYWPAACVVASVLIPSALLVLNSR
jgi:hypothetical protein